VVLRRIEPLDHCIAEVVGGAAGSSCDSRSRDLTLGSDPRMSAEFETVRPLREHRGARRFPRTVRIHRGVREGGRSGSIAISDRPTTEGTSGHRGTRLFAEARRSRGPRAHANTIDRCRREATCSPRGAFARPSLHRRGNEKSGPVAALSGPSASRSRVTPPSSELHPATRGVRSSGPNASSRFVERGGNVTGWETRLAEGLPPEPPDERAYGLEEPLRIAGPRGCKVDGRAREPFRLQRWEEGSSTSPHRPCSPGILSRENLAGRERATRRSRQVVTPVSRSANLARGASPSRRSDSDVEPAGPRHRRRRSKGVFAWTRGPTHRAPGGRTDSLVGGPASFDEGVSRRKPRGTSRVTSLAIRTKDGPAPNTTPGRAGACLHPTNPARATARAAGMRSLAIEPRTGVTA
jgi:hypothetical protein